MLVGALILSTALKIYLALFSPDTADAHGFVEYLTNIRAAGGIGIYSFRGSHNNPFNFPPAMIHVIKVLGFVSDISGLPFRFWLRMLPSVADVGSFFLVWTLLGGQKDLFRLLGLIALCPLAIMISGYEGNVDGLMIFFVLVSIWLIESKKRLWLAGIALGVALNVKVAPLMFVPAFLFYLSSFKSRLEYFAASTGTFLVCSLPFLIQDPSAIRREVFGYSSIYGFWGLTKLAVIAWGPPHLVHPPYDVTGLHLVFATVLKYLMLGVIWIVCFGMNQRRKKPNLLVQCGIVVAIFLFLTPGFGIQYLVWLVPFVPAAGVRPTLTYWVTTFCYVLFAMSDMGSAAIFLASLLICWLSVALCALALWRSDPRNASPIGSVGD